MCTHTPASGVPIPSKTWPVQRQCPSGTVGPGVMRRNGVPDAGAVAAVGSAVGVGVCGVATAAGAEPPHATISAHARAATASA